MAARRVTWLRVRTHRILTEGEWGEGGRGGFSVTLYLIVYLYRWSVCGSTKSDLAESSQAQNTYRGRVGEGGRGGFSVTVTLYLLVYPYRWSVCGSTKSDLAESSHT